MATTAQTTANQINAQSSTGPRTEVGKQTASHNNFRHGLASGQVLIEGEDLADYEAMRAGFFEEHKPSTFTETALVTSMVEHFWISRRAIRLQTEAFTAEGLDEKKLALFMRYQTTRQRVVR
jgi:hypothetical protein